MAREKKIVIRCPKCGKRLSSPSKVIGKQGRCTKCQSYFIAPTFTMHLVRRGIQFGTAGLLLFLLVGLPYLSMRAAKLAEIRANEMNRELNSIATTSELYEILADDAIEDVKTRLDGFSPPESNSELVGRVSSVRQQFQDAADALYLKLNPPPAEDEIRLVTRDPVATGEAKEFLEVGVSDVSNAYCGGEEYTNWAVGYDEVAQEKYLEVLRRKFREKGEFEKSSDYEALKQQWEEQRANRFVIARRELNEKNPPQTIIVDDLKALDVGDGFNADFNCWTQLKAIFNDKKGFNIRRYCRAVPDQSVNQGTLVHQGEEQFGDLGKVWKVGRQDSFFNLPIDLEEGKRFRQLLDSDRVRIGIVVRFPGESRFAMPSIEEIKNSQGPRGRNRQVSRVADSPFAVALRKFVVYDQSSGEIIFKHNLGEPSWSRLAFKPLNR